MWSTWPVPEAHEAILRQSVGLGNPARWPLARAEPKAPLEGTDTPRTMGPA